MGYRPPKQQEERRSMENQKEGLEPSSEGWVLRNSYSHFHPLPSLSVDPGHRLWQATEEQKEYIS
jgi:hypothetical protein